ncbi:MAG TPA: Rab family GTPase [Candidatus Deferrimicrobium sp.]|nr:Rab family GTPase [Candidatus Deferrimicrobium sp.]
MSKFTFKLVLLGDASVGKTSLVLRFINNAFSEKYISTIGADFLIKDLVLLGAPVRLMIWDIAGQTNWTHLRARYMQGADGCILVFDTSRETDIEWYVSRWLMEINDFIGETPLIIVGNKIDLKPEIDLKEAANYIKKLNHLYMETSAKTGDRVESMFQRISADIIKSKAEYVKRLKGVKEADISKIFNKIREKHEN